MEYLTLSKLSFFQLCALRATVTLALFLCITNPSSAARLEPQSKTSNTDFVKTSCEVTMYPDICYQSLSANARNNPDQPSGTHQYRSLRKPQQRAIDFDTGTEVVERARINTRRNGCHC
ncbi:hypothetical protein F3Y22_tig00111837pilonHSYRG00116 [Hibiscus syriacus]|uniref:Pectinesterase inhibitor domain-containing protein n=1 Tax=Hibiscus syriacus TaxID=106335 RepID=A0A6A2YFS1_HIBSY|nr:hypothetical protein F3Y22_tig00111837pilonHSYRG00116 [Hibiscus syriacus]